MTGLYLRTGKIAPAHLAEGDDPAVAISVRLAATCRAACYQAFKVGFAGVRVAINAGAALAAMARHFGSINRGEANAKSAAAYSVTICDDGIVAGEARLARDVKDGGRRAYDFGRQTSRSRKSEPKGADEGECDDGHNDCVSRTETSGGSACASP